MKVRWNQKSKILPHKQTCWQCKKTFHCTGRERTPFPCKEGTRCACPICYPFDLHILNFCWEITKESKEYPILLLRDKLKVR